MAYNGRSMSDCLPLTDPQEDADKLYAFLKQAEVEAPGDNGRSTVGTNPDQYPKPEGRASGNIDALWGDPDMKPSDPTGTAVHHSNVVLEEFRRGREEFLNRHFYGKKPSQEADRKLLAGQLSHAATGDYEASHAMPQANANRRPVEAPTLLSRTKRLLEH
jgi:hypothetical protein